MKYRLYAKFPDMTEFKAVDWKKGDVTDRLIYATIFDEANGQKALKEATTLNPESQFELRVITGPESNS